MRRWLVVVLVVLALLVPVEGIGAVEQIGTLVSGTPQWGRVDSQAGSGVSVVWGPSYTPLGVTGAPVSCGWVCHGRSGTLMANLLHDYSGELVGYYVPWSGSGLTSEDAGYPLTINVPAESGTTPSDGWFYGFHRGAAYNFSAVTVVFLAGQWWAGDGAWHSWGLLGQLPLSVSLGGVTTVVVGSSYDYTATVAGGSSPYTVTFQRVCTARPADDRTYASQTGSGLIYTQGVMFPSASVSYDVVVSVVDGDGATATDSLVVNGRVERPSVYGYLYEAATSQGGGVLLFYASLTPPGETWPGESGMLPVEGPGAGRYWYTLDVPGWATHWANGYTLSLAEPFPATVTAMITMHDQTTGDSWTLVFSLDTSGLTGPGSWTSSEGGGESFGEDENWIGRLLNSLKAMVKEVFQWLFVPTDDQMRSLVPSGTIANGLLEGVPSLGSGEKGVFTVSMKLPLSDGVEVPIMVIDTGEFASTTFAVVVRTVVQAGMSLGLILMVVSWI